MERPQQKHALEQQTYKMIQDLATMRDLLTHMSLALNDLKFLVDTHQRQEADAQAAACIARTQSH